MRRCRTMFSTSTMASSTRMPITSDMSQQGDHVDREAQQGTCPRTPGSPTSAAQRPTRSVARQSRRNSQTTSTASTAPSYSRCMRAVVLALCTGFTKLNDSLSCDVGVLRLQLDECLLHPPRPPSTSLSPRLLDTSKPTTGLPSSRRPQRAARPMVSLTRGHLVQANAPAIAQRQLDLASVPLPTCTVASVRTGCSLHRPNRIGRPADFPSAPGATGARCRWRWCPAPAASAGSSVHADLTGHAAHPR